jgi:hypothetical protein
MEKRLGRWDAGCQRPQDIWKRASRRPATGTTSMPCLILSVSGNCDEPLVACRAQTLVRTSYYVYGQAAELVRAALDRLFLQAQVTRNSSHTLLADELLSNDL